MIIRPHVPQAGIPKREPRKKKKRKKKKRGNPKNAENTLYKDENSFVLRLPGSISEKVKSMINRESVNGVSITMVTERNGVFSIGKQEYHCVLFNAPTFVESWKSLDRVNYFKVGEIGQVLKVFDRPPIKSLKKLRKIEKFPSKEDKRSFYTLPDGLTPPTKGIKYHFEQKNKPIPKEDIDEMMDLYEDMCREDEGIVKYEIVPYQTEEEMKTKKKKKTLWKKEVFGTLDDKMQMIDDKPLGMSDGWTNDNGNTNLIRNTPNSNSGMGLNLNSPPAFSPGSPGLFSELSPNFGNLSPTLSHMGGMSTMSVGGFSKMSPPYSSMSPISNVSSGSGESTGSGRNNANFNGSQNLLSGSKFVKNNAQREMKRETVSFPNHVGKKKTQKRSVIVKPEQKVKPTGGIGNQKQQQEQPVPRRNPENNLKANEIQKKIAVLQKKILKNEKSMKKARVLKAKLGPVNVNLRREIRQLQNELNSL